MRVQEIVVSAGRTFNHPYESYSNFKPGVSMKATLDAGEDPVAATQALQAKAEQLVEDHKRNTLDAVEKMENMKRYEQRASSLSQMIHDSQKELDDLRKKSSAVLPAPVEDPL